MSHVLGARTQLERRQKLGAWIDDQPEPQHLLRTLQPRAQLIQLQVREMEVAEEAYVQGLCMRASASEPGGDSGLTIAEDPFGSGRVEPFGQCREHHGDLVRWSFQPVQGGVTPSTEGGAASRTSKGLDALGMTMLAIPEKPRGSAHRCCRSTGTAGWDKRTLRSLYVWGLLAGFSSRARVAPEQTLALHPTRQWSRVDRRDNRLGCGASADGGASCAWLLLVRRKAEEGASHDARASPDREEGRPRAGTRTYEQA